MSNDTESIFKTLDVRDTLCPVPVILAQKAIQEVPVGEVLEILATDAGSVGDIPAWARNTGQVIVDTSEEQGVYRFLVKRKK